MTETTREATISITVNGQGRFVGAGRTIAAMLESIGLNPSKVAVERNLEVVPRSSLGTIIVNEGDKFEIVHFVGGG
jgi:thiazole synthase